MSERETRRMVQGAIARLPIAYREPLALYYCEQRSVPEVASTLGIREDAVHQRLSRARQLMADDLAELVERTLEDGRRRGRRRRTLAAIGALGAVIVWLVPSRATAATRKGWTMFKLSVLVTLVATAAVVAPVEPTTDAAAAPPAPPPAAPASAALQAPPPPILAAAAATADHCDVAARHLVDLAFEIVPAAPEGIDAEAVATIAAECRAAAWSPAYTSCIAAADDVWSTMICRRGTRPIPPGPEASCADAARTVAALTTSAVGELGIPRDDREAVDGELSGLHTNLESSCTRNHWPADARRCFASATSVQALEACK
jgi:hypothetical protein